MIYLNRIHSDSYATRGVLLAGGLPLCYTLELPWRDNARNDSCIPPGVYRLTKASSPRFAECFYVHDVPGRSGILIHPGNVLADTKGCILPGLDCTLSGVLSSRLAMARLYAKLSQDEILTVKG